ncbi:shikimate dehydrogenase [Magnetococcales bacterium HHB-1]
MLNMPQIDGSTKILGVIGDPIGHSLSPAMHNYAISLEKINFCYLPFHIKPKDLPLAIKGFQAQRVVGLNATIPHKEALIPLMDQLTPESEVIGAVNTVIFKEGMIIGDNTDGYGFITALGEVFEQPLKETPVLLLGAGGAARAVLVALLKAGVKECLVVNRTLERADQLISKVAHLFPECRLSTMALNWSELPLEKFPLLVNTTSLGLTENSGEIFSLIEKNFSRMNKDALIFDSIYSKELTPLLRAAKNVGLKTEDGLGMLIHQGARAFECWTSKPMDTTKVKAYLNQLTGRG